MLAPRKVKFRKTQKGRMRGMANSGDYVSFGSYGLKALEPGWITSRQIEAARITISRKVRKVGRMWIRIFPDKSITKKPAETRMGKGKVRQNIGWLLLSLEGYYLKLKVLMKKMLS